MLHKKNDYLGPQQIRCMTFSAFSASLNLLFPATLTFFIGSTVHENHLIWEELSESDLIFDWGGLVNPLDPCSFTPSTILTAVLLRYLKLILEQYIFDLTELTFH